MHHHTSISKKNMKQKTIQAQTFAVATVVDDGGDAHRPKRRQFGGVSQFLKVFGTKNTVNTGMMFLVPRRRKIMAFTKLFALGSKNHGIYCVFWTAPRYLPSVHHVERNPAHTALAVKACLLGGNSNTKCSMTFVNIAVAISALAGGVAKNGFAPRPEYGGVFDIFRGFLGVWAQEGIEMEFWVILVVFRQWKKRPKMKKTLCIARFCRVFGCQSIENTAKTSVLDWRYSKKRVNYRMLDWKHYKNTVKSNVLEGFTAFMAKNV